MTSVLRSLWILDKNIAITKIVENLQANHGDVTATAKVLEVGRNTLVRMIKESQALQDALKAIRGAEGWYQINGRHYPPIKLGGEKEEDDDGGDDDDDEGDA